MRGFLIFLACAVPVVLASPFFWSIVRMETSAERVGYTSADGVTQWAWLGPQAPWPDWALTPVGARLRVRSHFEAAPGRFASGFADIEARGAAGAVIADYANSAAAAGYDVSLSQLDTLSPDLPPQRVRLCMLEARQGARMLRLSIEEHGRVSRGTLYWAEGDVPAMVGAAPGACATS